MSILEKQDASSSRVNIKLKIHSNDDHEKKELSFKLLLLGAFEGNVCKKPFYQREKQLVNSQNINQVLSHLEPRLEFDCANYLEAKKERLSLSLAFKSMSDFTPDGLCQQIPALKKMVAMRHVLKDLKSLMLDHQVVTESLNALVTDQKKIGIHSK